MEGRTEGRKDYGSQPSLYPEPWTVIACGPGERMDSLRTDHLFRMPRCRWGSKRWVDHALTWITMFFTVDCLVVPYVRRLSNLLNAPMLFHHWTDLSDVQFVLMQHGDLCVLQRLLTEIETESDFRGYLPP